MGWCAEVPGELKVGDSVLYHLARLRVREALKQKSDFIILEITTLETTTKEKPMRLVLSFGKSLTLVAVLAMILTVAGCGESPENTETSPSTDLGAEEAGSTTGGGAEVPAAGGEG